MTELILLTIMNVISPYLQLNAKLLMYTKWKEIFFMNKYTHYVLYRYNIVYIKYIFHFFIDFYLLNCLFISSLIFFINSSNYI